jgi:hypothetical protein
MNPVMLVRTFTAFLSTDAQQNDIVVRSHSYDLGPNQHDCEGVIAVFTSIHAIFFVFFFLFSLF